MSKDDPKPTELSDDELLTRLGAHFRNKICRQKFGFGKKKVCALPKGHKGGHKQ